MSRYTKPRACLRSGRQFKGNFLEVAALDSSGVRPRRDATILRLCGRSNRLTPLFTWFTWFSRNSVRRTSPRGALSADRPPFPPAGAGGSGV